MADRFWEGGDVDTEQVNTVLLGGAWLAGDTISLTISDKVLTLTIGTAVTIPDILDNLIIMVSGTGIFGAGYSSNFLGNTAGEFLEIVATEDGVLTLTLTAVTAGTPFILASSRVTASTGTVTDATPTANNSKNDYANARNWQGGVVPLAGDVVLLADGVVAILFGLDQSTVAIASLTQRQSYTAEMGLPEVNEESAVPFPEYRGTFFQTGAAAITLGEGEGTGSGRIKIDSGATAVVAGAVRATGAPLDTDLGAVIWKGTGANCDWVVESGDVGFGVIALDVATIDVLTIEDATVRQVNGTIASLTVNGDGAGVDIRGDITTILETRGGTTTARGDLPSGAVVGVRVRAGTVNLYPRVAATVQDIIIFGAGVVDMTLADGTITAANATMYAGASLTDPNEKGIYSSGIDLVAAGLLEVTLDVGTDVTITPS